MVSFCPSSDKVRLVPAELLALGTGSGRGQEAGDVGEGGGGGSVAEQGGGNTSVTTVTSTSGNVLLDSEKDAAPRIDTKGGGEATAAVEAVEVAAAAVDGAGLVTLAGTTASLQEETRPRGGNGVGGGDGVSGGVEVEGGAVGVVGKEGRETNAATAARGVEAVAEEKTETETVAAAEGVGQGEGGGGVADGREGGEGGGSGDVVDDGIGEELEYGSLKGVRLVRGPSIAELEKRKTALEKWNSLEPGGNVGAGEAKSDTPVKKLTLLKGGNHTPSSNKINQNPGSSKKNSHPGSNKQKGKGRASPKGGGRKKGGARGGGLAVGELASLMGGAHGNGAVVAATGGRKGAGAAPSSTVSADCV